MQRKRFPEDYISLLDFIANACGPNCEVYLYDVSKPKASIVAIRNNQYSDGVANGVLLDFVQRIMKDKEYLCKDYITNHHSIRNGQEYYSSAYFIKEEGELIGLLCINNDISTVANLRRAFNTFTAAYDPRPQEFDISNENNNPLESLANDIVSELLSKYHVSPERMSFDEKREVVQIMNNRGLLQLKGAISETAKLLHISEATVYRYINNK